MTTRILGSKNICGKGGVAEFPQCQGEKSTVSGWEDCCHFPTHISLRTNGDLPSNIYIKNCLADDLLFERVTVIGVNDGGGVIFFKKHR